MAKSRYAKSIENLTEYLKEQEKARAKWAKEKWFHTEGKIYSFGRVFLPLLFVVSFVVEFLLCAIIYNNIPAVQRMRTGTKELQNTLAKDDPSVPIYLFVVGVCIVLILVTIICFVAKRYKNTEIMLVVNSAIICVFTIVRAFLDSSTYPDNSLVADTAPFSAIAIYVVSAILFGIMLIYSICLLRVKLEDNYQLKLSIESTLEKILPDTDEAKLLSEDDVAELVDKYLEKKKK